ncbi:TPA: ABC transporter permease, partial [Streptococcus agalactiae]
SGLDINVLPKFIIYVVIFMSFVLLVSLILSSIYTLRKNPKELLIDNN